MPTDPDEPPGLEDAYSLETPDDSRALYARWADSYDRTFIEAKGYQYHEHVADLLVAGDRPDGPVLDVGCGTGAVGEALRARGVAEIDGVDISREMLQQAGKKELDGPVYRNLLEADLTQPLQLESDTYAGLTSSGTFTHGHLLAAPLNELVQTVKSGGRCAVGINAAHWTDHGFERWFDAAVVDGVIRPFEIHRKKVYERSDPSNPDDMTNIVVFVVR